MLDTELENMSIEDLKKFQKDIEKKIAECDQRNRAEARAKVSALAEELGYSVQELFNTDVKKRRAAPAAKYQHPENASVTWSGRGRKPIWFVKALEDGKSEKDLLIK